MILFHGTTENSIKNIKKNGLLNTTRDQWITEVTHTNVCCVSNEPTSGEGGSPIHFAGRHERCVNQNGYLVVSSLPVKVYQEKLVAIFDNKILDDYVRYHFFLREEFRGIGFALYQTLQKIKSQQQNFDSVDPQFISSVDNFSSRDQKIYYKDVGQGDTSLFSLNGIHVSNHILALVDFLGSWEQMYLFLQFHFGNIKTAMYEKFMSTSPRCNAKYWKKFYQYFPPSPVPKPDWMFWFSPKWLENRKMENPTKNCQILTLPIAPEHISGFIHITNSSGVVAQFRPVKRQHKTRAKMTLNARIWRKVYRMLKSG